MKDDPSPREHIHLVAGPTASGKTALAIELAKELGRLPAGRQGETPVFLQKQYTLWIFSSLSLDKITQGLAPLLNPRLTPTPRYLLVSNLREGKAFVLPASE